MLTNLLGFESSVFKPQMCCAKVSLWSIASSMLPPRTSRADSCYRKTVFCQIFFFPDYTRPPSEVVHTSCSIFIFFSSAKVQFHPSPVLFFFLLCQISQIKTLSSSPPPPTPPPPPILHPPKVLVSSLPWTLPSVGPVLSWPAAVSLAGRRQSMRSGKNQETQTSTCACWTSPPWTLWGSSPRRSWRRNKLSTSLSTMQQFRVIISEVVLVPHFNLITCIISNFNHSVILNQKQNRLQIFLARAE